MENALDTILSEHRDEIIAMRAAMTPTDRAAELIHELETLGDIEQLRKRGRYFAELYRKQTIEFLKEQFPTE